MDPHRIYSSVCAVMVCLLGATRLSSGENCKCPAIPPKALTVRTDGCFQINSVYRYKCIPGYTRKPGTSNLIRCQEKNGVLQWTESLFKCITDPNYQPPPPVPDTTTADPNYQPPPPVPDTTTGPSSTLQSVRTSTSESAASPNTKPSALGGERTTVCISLIGVILFFVMCGVIFFLYRQRNKPIPPRDLEELEAMKC